MEKIIFLLGITVLVACSSSPTTELLDEGGVETAISGTLAAITPWLIETEDKMQLTMAAGQTQNASYQATKEARPTNTPRPTSVPTEKPTLAPTENIEELRAGILRTLVDGLLSMYDVEEVNLARLVDGVLEIEVRTVYASQGNQPDISYLIIKFISEIFGGREI
jgi:hypothetical protein